MVCPWEAMKSTSPGSSPASRITASAAAAKNSPSRKFMYPTLSTVARFGSKRAKIFSRTSGG